MNRAADAGAELRQMRFLYMNGAFNWKHLGEVIYLNPDADYVDCTDMTDRQFEAFVRVTERAQ